MHYQFNNKLATDRIIATQEQLCFWTYP